MKRIGADIGGTFTDIAALDENGVLRIGKRLTSHGSEDDAVVIALSDTGVDISGETVLTHGHTLVINSLLERKGARVGFVTTEGFADVIEMGRGSRPEIFNFRYSRDPVLVPSELRFEIAERTLASGEIIRQATSNELAQLARSLREARVEAVAIGFYNAYLEPANERLVAEYLRSELPAVPISISSDLSRQWGEYERFSTVTANAFVLPVAERYVQHLVDALHRQSFSGEFLVFDSGGGALTVDGARRLPVRTVESGPVAGVLGARELAQQLSLKNVVTFDMGGTTAKSCVIEDGRFATTELYWIGGYERGFPLQVRSVDITEVGAGGGSVAWMDESGRLRVGPRSAGSDPGPACYGLGGAEPTVTDANVYCGRINKSSFSGSLKLDEEAAEIALTALARRVRLDPRRLALGILKLANLAMAGAVRRQTLERGLDPRDFVLVAFGGAGPMHACEVAAEAGIPQVVVPLFPGHFSAIGMLSANLRLDRREVLTGLLKTVGASDLTCALRRVRRELEAEVMAAGDGRAFAPPQFSYSLALRYHGQDHTLLIPAANEGLQLASDFQESFQAAFETDYLRRYGHVDDQAEVEVTEVEVLAERAIQRAAIREGSPAKGPSGTVRSYFALQDVAYETPVIARGSLSEGAVLDGPVVIYEEGATTVVPPRARVRVVAGGVLVIDVVQVGRAS